MPKSSNILRHASAKRLTKDGRLLDIIVDGALFYDEEGQPAGQVITLRDVTAEKRNARINQAYFRIALSDLAKESMAKNSDASDGTEPEVDASTTFKVRSKDEQQQASGIIELELEGELVPIPDHVKELITSIIVDFGEIPPEHLHAVVIAARAVGVISVVTS